MSPAGAPGTLADDTASSARASRRRPEVTAPQLGGAGELCRFSRRISFVKIGVGTWIHANRTIQNLSTRYSINLLDIKCYRYAGERDLNLRTMSERNDLTD